MIRIQISVNSNKISAIREIFFASSARQDFASSEERQQFFSNWTDFYTKQDPYANLLAVDANNHILGYLMGCQDSARALLYYSEKNPSYLLFEDQFKYYPAHFHVNCHPDARGLGIGSLLISHFIEKLRKDKVAGVHIVTSPNADNRSFYARNKFDFELIRERKGHQLLFMGRKI